MSHWERGRLCAVVTLQRSLNDTNKEASYAETQRSSHPEVGAAWRIGGTGGQGNNHASKAAAVTRSGHNREAVGADGIRELGRLLQGIGFSSLIQETCGRFQAEE